MEGHLLNYVIVILGLSVLVVFVCQKARVPTIVGFFLTGILAGPHGLGLVQAVHEVEFFAEVGVVLLLFTIGIEFSLNRLLQIKKLVLVGGVLQVSLTALAVFAVARQAAQPVGESIFMGFLVALSSTAIVLKLTQERAEIDSPHGRTTLGILIFQDVIIVPMILVTPLLAGATGNLTGASLLLVAKGIGIIALVIICARWIVPRVLYEIARTRSRELFLLAIVVICFAVAWLTSSVGLSLALGAFLAGLIISESEYSHQALGNILPFRDVFMSFFFVSVGMLLDIDFLFRHLGLILLITAGVLIFKAAIAGGAAVLLGLQLRAAILVGFALSQIGEFSFILSKAGIEHGLLSGGGYQTFLSFSVLSMAATPFIMGFAPRVADFVLRGPVPERLKTGLYPIPEPEVAGAKNHVIIVGFGVNGRNVARAAKVADIPYVIIETNPETVRSEQEEGEPIYYGDATQEAVFRHAGIEAAKIVVVAINDPAATRGITELARRLNPSVYLIVRTRYFQEMGPLYALGADEVIPEEFETSVEIFSRVLTKYLVPHDTIKRFAAEVRSDGYEMFRSLARKTASFGDLEVQVPDIEINALRVGKGAQIVGKSLSQIELRKRYGVTVLAMRREGEIISNPNVDMPFQVDDVLFAVGSSEKIAGVISLFHNPGDKKGS
ncbi:MAG: cation:proton antiporter [Deltaproteobacteria bacterium]|nr:cation:proton antiporter [Deltaproteobacteria bacterium]